MSSRVAARDQRVAMARARLREATTESQRADAVLAEFEAKLCFDRACWDRAVGPTPAVAARVAVGRLSLEEAVLIERANGDEAASALVRELVALLSAGDWLALEACVPVDPWLRVARCERAVREEDRDGARLLLDAAPLYPSIVVCLAKGFGREFVSVARARALAAIAEQERQFADDPLSVIEAIARLSYALNVDEQRAWILDLAARLEATDYATVSELLVPRRYPAVIAVALLACGEHGSAQRWIEGMIFDDLGSVVGSFADAHAPLFEALRVHGTPEQYAWWEQRIRDWLAVPTNFARLDHKCAVARGEWRSELEARVRSSFDATGEHWGPFDALTDEQVRRWLRRQWDRPATRDGTKRFIERLRADPAFEAELLRWRPLAPLRARSGLDADEHLALLVDAARDNNRAAIDAVCTWSSPDEVLSVSGFADGLPRVAVEAILDRATGRADPPQDILDSAARALVYASDEAIERWRRERDVCVIRERDDRDEARERALEDARRWLATGDERLELTPAIIDAARTLDGGVARIAQHARRFIAAAKAEGWPGDRSREDLELSLVDHCDLETIAMLVDRSWQSVSSALAHRTVLRCAEWLAKRTRDASTQAASTTANDAVSMGRDELYRRVQTVRAQALEGCRETPLDEWERALLEAYGEDSPAGVMGVLRASPGVFEFGSTYFVRDCVQLGIVDDVLGLLVERAGDPGCAERICELLPLVSETAGRAAVAALREAFRRGEIALVHDELLPWLTAEDIVLRWDTLVSSSMWSMLYGPLLAKVGGAGLVDRIGDGLVELRAP